MHNLVDLHLHSLFSDGILTPTELVAEAASLGLRAIALADHDNVDGIPEALAAGLKYDVEIIPAVELSVQWEELSDIHLLGYAFDHKNAALQKALAEFRDFRAGRSERILVLGAIAVDHMEVSRKVVEGGSPAPAVRSWRKGSF